MSEDREHDNEGFLGRWSRVKSEARENALGTPPSAPPVESRPEVDPAEPPPELPALDQLTFESDFRDFFHPKVDEDVRRQALRKLFSDPHFNVMDGLDVYIDDYSKSEPIPAAMLAGLRQAQRIFEWAAEKPGEKDASPELASSTDVESQTGDATDQQIARQLERADQSSSPESPASCFDSAARPDRESKDETQRLSGAMSKR